MDLYLEFEQEMLLNVMNENSLTITSKGIANDRLLLNLVRVFSTSCKLVLVIGADQPEEESVIMQMAEILEKQSSTDVDENYVPPKRIVCEPGQAANRRDIYLSGGVMFITTRILVVDMLTKRLPFEAVTGFIVVNAHRVLKDCHMSFILRLFRLHNKTGFITAMSQNAQAFLGSFAKLERIMRKLFVTKVFLWPRFHAAINNSLSTRLIPEVIEVNIPMTSAMEQIQFALMDLISKCVKELSSMNSFIYSSSMSLETKDTENEDALTTINVIAKSFNKIVRAHLDSVWFQLSPRARRLIRDIRQLKTLLFHLTELDAVQFYSELKHIRDKVSIDSNPADWLFWGPTDTLFKVAEERVFLGISSAGKRDYNIEINPKLEELDKTLNEIEEEFLSGIKKKRSRVSDGEDGDGQTSEPIDSDAVLDIIIVVENRYSSLQIDAFRDKGISVVLSDMKNKCDLLCDNKLMKALLKDSTKPTKAGRLRSNAVEEFEEQLTLTQMLAQYQTEEETISRKHNRLRLNYFEWGGDSNCALGLKQMLAAIQPRHVLLYEPEMACIRQVELYQALYGGRLQAKYGGVLRVHYFIYVGSAEEQRYLRNLQLEKDSFERLIEEKAKLAKAMDGDGTAGLHPDLIRGSQPFLHPEEKSGGGGGSSSRMGGGGAAVQTSSEAVVRQVLVDMREFRSLLPSCVHKMDIELEPVTLEIGDYVLSPDTCLERKSVADLIGSLNNGRLYSQAQVMTRYYKRPLLLIEFDEPKSFNFKARYWSSAQHAGGASNPFTTSSRPSPLLQLSVLAIHFPQLRFIWSPSPAFSAEIIDQLKQGKEEPTKERDIVRTSQQSAAGGGGQGELPIEYITDRYDIEAKEFLFCLPGVTSANIYSIMNQVKSLAALVDLSIEELTEIMESSVHATMLHRALHSKLVMPSESEMEKEKAKANAKKRFAYARKKPAAK